MQSLIAPMARDMKTTENLRIFGSFSLINHILECGVPSLLHTVGNACPKIHEVTSSANADFIAEWLHPRMRTSLRSDFIRECGLHRRVTSSANADFIAE